MLLADAVDDAGRDLQTRRPAPTSGRVERPVFGHGMYYVAASRVASRIRFAIEPVSNARPHAATHPGHYTKN